jgi:hypothetical protein
MNCWTSNGEGKSGPEMDEVLDELMDDINKAAGADSRASILDSPSDTSVGGHETIVLSQASADRGSLTRSPGATRPPA